MCPSTAIVSYTVAAGIWCDEGLFLTLVQFGFGYGVLIGGRNTFGGEAVFGYFSLDTIPNGTIETYTGETFGAGEDNLAFGIIPCIVLVLLKDRELYGINHLQIFEG